MDEVTDETFAKDVLASPVPVIVDFWAPWCKPCEAIEPHLVAIVDAHEGRLRLARLNVDENLAVSGRYEVLSLPTVMLFSDGDRRLTIVGSRSRSHYERAFAPLLR